MKKTISLVIGGIVLFLFIAITSFLWYKVFYKGSDSKVAVLEVRLDKSSSAVVNEQLATPIQNIQVEDVTPYTFRVHNTSSESALYQVLIEDAVLKEDSLYQGKALLSRSQLSYQLKLNGTTISEGKLSDIKNNILDEKSIGKGKANEYELRVYLDEDSFNTDWQNKYYHYKINIKTEGDLK